MPNLSTFQQKCLIWVFLDWNFKKLLFAKFCEETKMPKFGTKNTFIGYF